MACGDSIINGYHNVKTTQSLTLKSVKIIDKSHFFCIRKNSDQIPRNESLKSKEYARAQFHKVKKRPPKRPLIKAIFDFEIVKVSLELILCGKAGIG